MQASLGMSSSSSSSSSSYSSSRLFTTLALVLLCSQIAIAKEQYHEFVVKEATVTRLCRTQANKALLPRRLARWVESVLSAIFVVVHSLPGRSSNIDPAHCTAPGVLYPLLSGKLDLLPRAISYSTLQAAALLTPATAALLRLVLCL